MTENIATGNKFKNIIIAGVAIVLSLALFFGLQSQSDSTTLENQAANSTPLEVALGNNKPTLIEFYANWCTSCQAMAADLSQLKQKYGEKVNFVMLNVDNGKWLPEILHYRVDGIPHFVFLNNSGEAIAESIGEQPKNVLIADLDALIDNEPLPYTYNQGQVSPFTGPVSSPSDPRSHSIQSQVGKT